MLHNTAIYNQACRNSHQKENIKKNPRSFLLVSLILPYLLVCYAFRVTTESGWCEVKDFSPSPFSEQLIGKLTSDVHLHLSSFIHLSSGKISTTEQLAMLLTHTDGRLRKAHKGTETQVFIVKAII